MKNTFKMLRWAVVLGSGLTVLLAAAAFSWFR